MQHLPRLSAADSLPLPQHHLFNFITSTRFHRRLGVTKISRLSQLPGICSTSTRRMGFSSIWCVVGDAGHLFDESPQRKVENGYLIDEVGDENDEEGEFKEGDVQRFFVSDAEGDPDCPTQDDENIEGNLIMAASFVTQKHVAFMMRHGSGIVSVAMKDEDLQRLKLPLMSPDAEQHSPSSPAFTVTVDAKIGTASGVSASDRASTIRSLASPESSPGDFRRPGHVFPLKYRTGGVLRRAGHTEASMDLVTLAGLLPVSVLSAIVNPSDGSIALISDLQNLAMEYNIPIVTVADLIRYRRKREKLVERTIVSPLLTRWGLFQTFCYKSKLGGTEHLAMVKGEIGNGHEVMVRVHSECLTGDIFGSGRCDCGNQLSLAMQLIEEAGRGVVIYLRGHEGRGIGLGHKLSAYNLQDLGHDTVDANLELGLAVDSREYGIGAQMLRDLGVRTMKLMTNNPAKFTGLKGYGLAVVGRIPVLTPITEENKRYLETKRLKMGHVYGSDIQEPLAGFINPSKDQEDSSS